MRLRSSCPSIPITRLTPVTPRSDSMRESCRSRRESLSHPTTQSPMNGRTSMYSTEFETATAGGANILLRFTRRSTEMNLRRRVVVSGESSHDDSSTYVPVAKQVDSVRWLAVDLAMRARLELVRVRVRTEVQRRRLERAKDLNRLKVVLGRDCEERVERALERFERHDRRRHCSVALSLSGATRSSSTVCQSVS